MKFLEILNLMLLKTTSKSILAFLLEVLIPFFLLFSLLQKDFFEEFELIDRITKLSDEIEEHLLLFDEEIKKE
jgi:hypothetical protein